MRNLAAVVLMLVLNISFNATAWAYDCRKTSDVCIDGPSTKDIGGVAVYRSCWQYKTTYECVAQNNIDYCAGIRRISQCFQVSSTCTQRTFNGECAEYTNVYECGDPINPPTGVVELDETHTIITDKIDRSECSSFDKNPFCKLAQKTCIEPGGTRNIDGLDVTKDCWKWEEKYTCAVVSDECADLRNNKDCELTTTTCESRNPDGTCALKALTFSCATGTTEETNCNGGKFCLNGMCFDSPVGNDKDFAMSITLMEAGREAAGYATATDDIRFFSGEGAGCTKNFLTNCCRSNAKGAQMSNGAVISAVMQAGKQAWGSWYVYDTLVENARNTNAVGAILSRFTGASATEFQPTGITYYGVTFNPFATGQMFSFDPYSFAASIALQILMQYLSCDPSEEVLAMQRGQNLCTYVGSYCTQKFLGSCVSRKTKYCCFNSRLARLINEQGRAQLGLGWGDAENPSCEGFTDDQFNSLDFSAMDFSEFIEEIMKNVKMPDVNAVQSRNQDYVKDKIDNYFGR